MKTIFKALVLAALLSGLACDSWTFDEYGEAGQGCYSHDQCDAGLECISGICQLSDGDVPSGDGDTLPDGDKDADPDGDADTDGDPDPDGTDGDLEPDGDSDVDVTDGDVDTDGDSDGDVTDGDVDPDGDSDVDVTDGDVDPDGDSDPDETDGDLDPDGDLEPDREIQFSDKKLKDATISPGMSGISGPRAYRAGLVWQGAIWIRRNE